MQPDLFLKINELLKNKFAKNVGVLTLGTAAAQFISLVVTPFSSRLFTPSDYGLAALFAAVATITATLVSLSYPIRIMLPKTEDEAMQLAAIAVFLSTILGGVLLIFAMFLSSSVFNFLGLSSLGSWVYVGIVIGIFIALINIVNYWFNRNEQYKHMAALKIIQALIAAVCTLVMGLMSVKMGLIYSQIITIMTASIIFIILSKIQLRKTNFYELITTAKNHKSAPYHLYPTALLDVVTAQLPIILIALWFAADMAGQYRMAYSLLAIPAGLIGTAVSQVFYNRFNTLWPDSKKAKRLLLKTMGTLGLFSFIPFLIVFLGGEQIFSFVLGSEWSTAGQMSSILSLFAFCSLIHSSTSTTYIVLSMEKFVMLLSVPVVFLRILSLYIGHLNNDLFLGLRLFMFFEIANFLVFQYFVLKKIKEG